MKKGTVVVDCSFFLATFLPDEPKENFDFNAFFVYVPSLFFLECLNVLTVVLKRQRISREEYEKCLELFQELPFHIDNLSTIPASLPRIESLCNKHGLTSYDGSYLELALRLQVPLATLDKKLIAAAHLEGIGLIQ
ncbi:MAG: type II toxin-antitoxin system VapC family toxin [Alphaproteobacteria bacterium]|nr:type II toxin-antitoxin system VapC family toxin [Alphaproteobacteria bacterium]